MKNAIIPAILIVLLAGVMTLQSARREPVVAEAPSVSLGEVAGFTSRAGDPGGSELSILPADTRLERRFYRDVAGREHCVTLVVGGRSKNSIHRPELCLPSQGFRMSSPTTLDLGNSSWRTLELTRGISFSGSFAYTFFNQAGFRTSSHARRIVQDVWDRSIFSRIDRWAMVTVLSPPMPPVERNRFLQQLWEALK